MFMIDFDCCTGGRVTFNVGNDAPTLTGAKVTFTIDLEYPHNQKLQPNGEVVWAEDFILNGTRYSHVHRHHSHYTHTHAHTHTHTHTHA